MSDRWYNPLMKWLLRSPLHGLVSGHTMLITYRGRKSGKTYNMPVSYVREDGVLYTVSWRERTWWRNLRSGAPVTVRVKGRDVRGMGEAITDRQAVAEALTHYLRLIPRYGRYLGITLDSSGQPDSAQMAAAAEKRVMVRVQLD